MEYLLGSGLLGLTGFAAWLAYVAISATRQRADAVIARAAAEAERDVLRGDVAMLHAENDALSSQITQLARELAAARRSDADVAVETVRTAADPDAAADRVLARQRAEDDARVRDGGGAPAALPRPGHPAEPVPAWVGGDAGGAPDVA